MNAKNFLKQLKKLDYMITNKMIEKERWLSRATDISVKYGGDRVQTSGSQSRMADAVCRYVDMEKEIDADIDRLVDAKNEVIEVIEQLSAVEYDVLHKVYVQYMTFDEVADIYDRSYSMITTIHGRALKNVQRILEEKEDGEI